MKAFFSTIMVAIALTTNCLQAGNLSPNLPSAGSYSRGYSCVPDPCYSVGSTVGGAIGSIGGPLGTLGGTLVGGLLGTFAAGQSQEQLSCKQTRDQIYVDWMLRHYEPARHVEFVQSIRQSSLPKEWKMRVIYHWNVLREDQPLPQ